MQLCKLSKSIVQDAGVQTVNEGRAKLQTVNEMMVVQWCKLSKRVVQLCSKKCAVLAVQIFKNFP